MLLSPGNSPRHISSTPQKTLTQDSPSPNPNPNPNPRKRKGPSVLDEDSYVAAIEKIIERDFFPDIPKLRDRLDWLEAVRSADPVLIRDAQLKIIERRSNATRKNNHPGRSLTRTPGFSVTPGFTVPDSTPSNPDLTVPIEASDDDLDLTLDEFFRRYTSEDNESFSKILEKVNAKRREKYSHLLEGEKPLKALTLEEEARDRITDGFGTSGQPASTLEGWNYTAKNLLMYNPVDRGEVPLTEEERAERMKQMTKEINRSNTRFHGMSDKPTKEEEAVAILYAPVPGTTPGGAAWPFPDRELERTRKYDLDDLRKTPNPFFVESNKKADNGYSYVKTPSPAPGADESPFMTWGEIEGTPLRLDLEESPVGTGGSSEGPHFRIPLPPKRDVKAHSLSRDAARKLRERSKMFQKPPLPSPARGGSASPTVRNLSPAAQKFVRNAIAKTSSSVDETLRASYRGASPAARTPKDRTGLTRFSTDGSLGSRSPSTKQASTPPW